MIRFSDVFSKTQQVYIGTNTKRMVAYRTFLFVESYFDDEWYNFIVPKASDPGMLEIEAIEEELEQAKEKGKKVSYYIHESLIENYASWLESKGYKDFGAENYLELVASEELEVDLPSGYEFAENYYVEEVISLLESCFPEWPQEREYFELYDHYLNSGQEGRVFGTKVIHYEGKPVAAGSVVIDTSLGISYLHNAGVDQKHRRKGLHTALLNARINEAIHNGVDSHVSITDEEAASFYSMQKQGFDVVDKFVIYAS